MKSRESVWPKDGTFFVRFLYEIACFCTFAAMQNKFLKKHTDIFKLAFFFIILKF